MAVNDNRRLQNLFIQKFYPFLGYWGIPPTDQRFTVLKDWGLRSHPGPVSQWSSPQGTNDPLGWQVCYFNTTGDLTQALQLASACLSEMAETTLATASASGLPKQHRGDLWVEAIASRSSQPQLALGREPFGFVPLYYHEEKEQGPVQRVWFASHFDLLLPLLKTQSLDLQALYGYSCFSYVPTPLTPVVGIQQVPAGTVLAWQCEGDRLRSLPTLRDRPWDKLENGTKLQDESTAVVQLQAQLRAAIATQTADLKRDQPVGVFLSGGLDSTVVAALLVQAGLRVRAYSLDFGDFGQSELPYAEQVAAALKIPLVKVPASPRQIRKALGPTVRALGMPFGDGVTVPLYLLGQAAAKDVQVVFNGEGGDQLFAGWTNKPLVAAGVYDAGVDWGLAKSSPSASFVQAYLKTFHRLWGYETQVFLPAIAQQVQSYVLTDGLEEALSAAAGEELLDRLRRASLMLKGAQNIHPRATALAAVHGLKVRSPFCDLSLAQWTFRLEGPLLLQGACEKFILKQAIALMVPELPTEVIWRTKRGMGVPLSAWCYQVFWGDVGRWLNPERLRAEGVFHPQVAATTVAGQLGAGIQGRRIGEILWLLMIWELWRQDVGVAGLEVIRKTGYLGNRRLSWDHPFWQPQWLWRLRQRWRDDL